MSSNQGVDAVSAELTAIHARLVELASLPTEPALGDQGAGCVDRIAVLEQLRSTVAAAQHTAMVTFGRAQVEAQIDHINDGSLDPEKLGRGIADQIALAAHVSPHVADRRLSVARALATDLPCTRAALVAGRISESLAEQIVSLAEHLDPELRALVDKQCADAGLEDMSRKAAMAAIKKVAYEADPAGFVARARTARKDRRVTLRPAPDTMSVLSGLLPVEQGVACLAALCKHADSLIATGDTDGRSRDQIVADTLVERLTGQARAEDVNVEVGIVLPLDTLTDFQDAGTGELIGHGPLPAGIVRDILGSSKGRRWWRRLFTHPAHGTLIGGETQRRLFDGFLTKLITWRDHGWCREAFCTAPIPYRRAPLSFDQTSRAPKPAARPVSGTAAAAACATTRTRNCPAGATGSSTTGSATTRTPSRPPPRPATPTPAEPDHDDAAVGVGRSGDTCVLHAAVRPADTAPPPTGRRFSSTARARVPADHAEETVMFTEETARADGEGGTSGADGYMVLVIDPVTGHADCYGPYDDEAQAQERAFWRRLEFDVADLPDVLIGVVPWHAEGGRPGC